MNNFFPKFKSKKTMIKTWINKPTEIEHKTPYFIANKDEVPYLPIMAKKCKGCPFKSQKYTQKVNEMNPKFHTCHSASKIKGLEITEIALCNGYEGNKHNKQSKTCKQ